MQENETKYFKKMNRRNKEKQKAIERTKGKVSY